MTGREPWPARRILLLVGLPAFALLVVGALAVSVPSMERGLERRAMSDLAAAGFDTSTLDVTFDGRDATVRGTVDSQSARATIDDVISHDGVRAVQVLVRNTALPAPPAPAGPGVDPDAPAIEEMMANEQVLSIVLEDGELTLRGRIRSSQRREALIQRLAAEVAPVPLTFELQVDPEAERTDDVGLLVRVLRATLDDATRLLILVDADTVLVDVSTTVDPDAVRAELEEIAADEGVELQLTAEFVVPVPTAQDLVDAVTPRLTGDAVFVAGTVQLSDTAEELLDEVAEAIDGSGGAVELRVHVDGPAGDEATELAEAQADVLVLELARRGISLTRLAGVGVGAGEPVADAGDPANRRIEITVVGG